MSRIDSRRQLFAYPLLVLLLLATADPGLHPAIAASIVVDSSGQGDCTELSAALDSLDALVLRGILIDSILVRPGSYHAPVHLRVVPGAAPMPIVGLSAATTTLDSVEFSASLNFPAFAFDGITVRGQVLQGDARAATWIRCEFLNGYSVYGNCAIPNLEDCVLRGRCVLDGFDSQGSFRRLHFIGAPLYARTDPCGFVAFLDCSFEGPADTLVYGAPSSGENPFIFGRCTFSNAGNGLVMRPSCGNSHGVFRCRFENLSGTAISLREDGEVAEYCGQTLQLDNCSFVSCGTGVEWLPRLPAYFQMSADTVSNCTHLGVTTASPPTLIDVIIEGNGGDGLRLERRGADEGGTGALAGLSLKNTVIRGNGGHGVTSFEAAAPTSREGALIEDCIIAGNQGAGVHVEGAGWTLRRVIVADNHLAGIQLVRSDGAEADTIENCTVVQNGGSGIVIERLSGPVDPEQLVRRDISAFNGGAGISVQNQLFPTVSDNDSWANTGPAFVNVPNASAENLTVDPLFCDSAANDFTLASTSPAATTGPYGQLGALGVGCDAPTAALGSLLSFDATPQRVRLVWEVGGPSAKAILERRSEGEREQRELASLLADGSGRAYFEDATVIPGRRYYYRLAFSGSGGVVHGPEAAVAVPTVSLFALSAAWADPAGDGVVVEFALPDASVAKLELFDVLGRNLAAVEVGSRGAGSHRVALATRLPPGLCFVRLVRLGEAPSRRVIMLR